LGARQAYPLLGVNTIPPPLGVDPLLSLAESRKLLDDRAPVLRPA
jgi:hypothetical protein